MIPKLFQRRTVWLPTVFGWACILIAIGSLGLLFCLKGEAFLSPTERLPAKVLVVEGWIGIEGIRAAKAEFERDGYDFIVTTGGLTGERWKEQRWSYAEMAEKELIRCGVSKDRIIMAPAPDVDSQRTFESAMAVRKSLLAHGNPPEALNVFTLGVHARRSRLIFTKSFPPGTKVGVIAWVPPGYESPQWWRSSERADDLLKETAGFLFEALFDSGRSTSSSR